MYIYHIFIIYLGFAIVWADRQTNYMSIACYKTQSFLFSFSPLFNVSFVVCFIWLITFHRNLLQHIATYHNTATRCNTTTHCHALQHKSFSYVFVLCAPYGPSETHFIQSIFDLFFLIFPLLFLNFIFLNFVLIYIVLCASYGPLGRISSKTLLTFFLFSDFSFAFLDACLIAFDPQHCPLFSLAK